MSPDALISSDDLLNLTIYDTLCVSNTSSEFDLSNVLLEATCLNLKPQIHHLLPNHQHQSHVVTTKQNMKKRKRRKPRASSKNTQDAESQRMTHIAVERNRRKQMNHHLSVLRSLMPPSYVQRGDQASIVGGAIEFVKELEQLLQALEAQKLQLQQQGTLRSSTVCSNEDGNKLVTTPPFAQFFKCPQYTWSQIPFKYEAKDEAATGDIEVTLIETHANLRILTTKTPSLLTHLVSAFHSLFLTILHISVTSFHPLVLYSISAKLEEQCQLTSVDDIAAAVHHMLRIIEGGAALA